MANKKSKVTNKNISEEKVEELEIDLSQSVDPIENWVGLSGKELLKFRQQRETLAKKQKADAIAYANATAKAGRKTLHVKIGTASC